MDGHHISNPYVSHTKRLIHNDVDDNIMDGWASYFESLCTPADVPSTKEQLILESYHTTQSMPADEPDLVLVSEEEVRLIIHSLPLKKAAGISPLNT